MMRPAAAAPRSTHAEPDARVPVTLKSHSSSRPTMTPDIHGYGSIVGAGGGAASLRRSSS
jgi:hypothetical protein